MLVYFARSSNSKSIDPGGKGKGVRQFIMMYIHWPSAEFLYIVHIETTYTTTHELKSPCPRDQRTTHSSHSHPYVTVSRERKTQQAPQPAQDLIELPLGDGSQSSRARKARRKPPPDTHYLPRRQVPPVLTTGLSAQTTKLNPKLILHPPAQASPSAPFS